MNININYLDNVINLDDESIFAVEIENKKYFYRIVNSFYEISNGNMVEEIKIFKNLSELNYLGKIQVFTNFFEFDFDSKKYNNGILKYINDTIDDDDRNNIIKSQQTLLKVYNKVLNRLDLPLIINSEINVETLTKFLKISVKRSNELLDNILLLIDLERELRINELLIFVNIKSYLTELEIKELYKYALYNKVKILLIDSKSYGVSMVNERKLIIDMNLDEFMI